MKRRVYVLLVLLCVYSVVRGQTERGDVPVKMLVYQHLDNDSVLRQFQIRFRRMDALIRDMRPVPMPPVLYTGVPSRMLDSLYTAKGKDELRAFRRKSGLELTGQAYYRLDDAFGFDEDDQYSQYKAKLQGEVGWNFFNSSFYQRKSETLQIVLSNELQNIEHGKRLQSGVWKVLQDSVTLLYDQRIAAVLLHRLENTDLLNMAYQYTLEQDKVNNEGLLRAMNDKMDIEYALLQTGSPDYLRREPLVLPAATLIRVDSVRLYEFMERNNPDIRASRVREDLLAVKRRLTNYGQEMRLTPFVRASHYFRENAYNGVAASPSTNIDLGVRFTFPLYDDTSRKRKALRTEQVLETMDRGRAIDEAKERCRILLERLDGLNRAIATEHFHLSQMEVFIGKRRMAYWHSLNGYNYITRLEEYNSYLKGIERLYKLMLSRNLCLLDIQRTAGLRRMESMLYEQKVEAR